MTTETAAEMLNGSYKFAISYPSLSDKDGDQRLFINVEALGMAIEALKKQIPKKPNFDTIGDDEYWYCPSCGEVVLAKIKHSPILDEYDHSHCGGCGQAIDWEAEE